MKLIDQCRDKLRVLRYALRTERCYLARIERFIRFCWTPDAGFRHPREWGAAEVTAFLTHLAARRNVSASTQNQALAALLFLYSKVLARDSGRLGQVRHLAHPPPHLRDAPA